MLGETAGLRKQEFLAMRWHNVDFNEKHIRVVEALEETRKYGLRVKNPKTESGERTIPLPSVAMAALRIQKTFLKEMRLNAGAKWEDIDLVCPNTLGNLWDPHDFNRDCRALFKNLELPYVEPKGLRHTHITLLLEANIHPKIAQERAGHASISVTMDVYSHVKPNMQQEAAKKTGELLRFPKRRYVN